jgi:uncharacterized membrane protein
MSTTQLESPTDRRNFRLLALLCVSMAATSLAWLVLQQGWGGLGRVAAVCGTAQVAGKWLIFAGASANNPSGFGPWELSYVILNTDLLIALVLNTFLPQLERVVGVGPWLVRTRMKAGETFGQYPKLKRMAWWGVTMWVLLPLPASGAVTGSFAARLIGMSRMSAVSAIAAGSIFNSVLFAAMAQAMGAQSEALLHNWPVTVASGVLLLLVGWWAWRRLVKILREDE